MNKAVLSSLAVAALLACESRTAPGGEVPDFPQGEAVSGTLERVEPQRLTLRDQAGCRTFISLDAHAQVFDGRRRVSPRALLPEEQVRVAFVTRAHQRMARQVEILQVPDNLRRQARRIPIK